MLKSTFRKTDQISETGNEQRDYFKYLSFTI
jgi:hypothetical protein